MSEMKLQENSEKSDQPSPSHSDGPTGYRLLTRFNKI